MFIKAIAKGTERRRYDSCTCVVTDFMGANATNNPVLDPAVMVPLHTMLDLNDITPSFIPYQLLNGKGATDQEFSRHANMYTQYRVKCIRFEYVPANAIVGQESNFPILTEPVDDTTDVVAGIIQANTINTSCMWMIKWPNKRTGTFQDFGYNVNNPTNNLISNRLALTDPTVIKIPITEKLVLSWKPRVCGYRNVNWRPLEQPIGVSFMQNTTYPVAKKFPWTNIIDNFDSVGTAVDDELIGVTEDTAISSGPYNTTGLRCPMTYPLIACYDAFNERFLASADFPSCGRWTIHTVFEFRNKRGFNAGPVITFAENVTKNTTGMPTVPTINF